MDAGGTKRQNITVAVRVRPLSQKEVLRGAFACLEVEQGTNHIICADPDDKQVESLGGHKVTDYLRFEKTKDRDYYLTGVNRRARRRRRSTRPVSPRSCQRCSLAKIPASLRMAPLVRERRSR